MAVHRPLVESAKPTHIAEGNDMAKIRLKNILTDVSYDYPHLIGIFLPGEPIFFEPFDPSTALDHSDSAQTATVNDIEIQQELINDCLHGTLTINHSQVFEVETNIAALKAEHGIIRDMKVFLKLNLYDLLSKAFTSKSPWGTLVGIRPVKLAHEAMDLELTHEAASAYLKAYYRISDDKINLMLTIARLERPILIEPEGKNVSLYICIPFCKTRCVYCSFPSNPLDKKGHLLTKYTDALLKEIEATAERLHASGLTVDCLYIGGGTPTALDENNFSRLLEAVSHHFDLSQVKEYTVEAGRPDTITTQKLEAMKQHQVSRICLNPQTMNDETLVKIGRSHSSEDIMKLYEEARHMGFDVINADLIVGLMDESLEHMQQTMTSIKTLMPENVTLHTLAVKRASRLNEFKDSSELQAARQVEDMMAHASETLESLGYLPYYMYRQKQMIGNLENIGYTLPGHVCLYNVRIMEERHSIVALGAGAVSKLFFKEENRLERFSNSKGVEDYIARIDELVEKKNNWLTMKYSLL